MTEMDIKITLVAPVIFPILLFMDLVLHTTDEYILDSLWACLVPLNGSFTDHHLQFPNASVVAPEPHFAWPQDYIPRQLLLFTILTLIGIHLIYFTFARLSIQFLFNHQLMCHPHFLRNQIRFEIQTSLTSFHTMMLLMLPRFQAEVMGYSHLYDNVFKYRWPYFALLIPLCIPFHQCLLILTCLQILDLHRIFLILDSSCSPSSLAIQNHT